jgi:hypothetical protein
MPAQQDDSAGPVVHQTFNFCGGCCHGGQPCAEPASRPGQVPAEPLTPRKGRFKRFAPFGGSALSNAIGGVLTAAALALSAWLGSHYVHHGGQAVIHHPRPSATAPAPRK